MHAVLERVIADLDGRCARNAARGRASAQSRNGETPTTIVTARPRGTRAMLRGIEATSGATYATRRPTTALDTDADGAALRDR